MADRFFSARAGLIFRVFKALGLQAQHNGGRIREVLAAGPTGVAALQDDIVRLSHSGHLAPATSPEFNKEGKKEHRLQAVR